MDTYNAILLSSDQRDRGSQVQVLIRDDDVCVLLANDFVQSLSRRVHEMHNGFEMITMTYTDRALSKQTVFRPKLPGSFAMVLHTSPIYVLFRVNGKFVDANVPCFRQYWDLNLDKHTLPDHLVASRGESEIHENAL